MVMVLRLRRLWLRIHALYNVAGLSGGHHARPVAQVDERCVVVRVTDALLYVELLSVAAARLLLVPQSATAARGLQW